MEPLSSALLGAVVSQLLIEAIGAARKACRCKENCRKLLASLEELVPLVNTAKENSDKNDDCKAFLSGFQNLLEEARSAADECAWKSGVGNMGRLKHVCRFRKLPSRIMEINSRIKDKIANSGLLTLTVALSIEKQVTPETTTAPIEFITQPTPKKVVGVKGPFDKLKTLILAGHAKDNPSYLGLKGGGGAGKTLLAQMLNNDEDIQGTYGADCILWITIGLDASLSSLYSTMGKFLSNGIFERDYRDSNEEDQRTYLTNAFSKKKMLLILDDVWDKLYKGHQLMEWLDIAKGGGSVTLVTTRDGVVLSRIKAEVQDFLHLSEEDSWELFCHHAFQTSMPPSLEIGEIARNICKECKGLPLALKVIGSAMIDKLHIGEWRCFLRDVKQSEAYPNEYEQLFYRLRLSYNELDEVTKRCFLYFAAFPEDYAVNSNQLFQIWLADGLLGSLEGEEAVDKAKTYLATLQKRSLVEWNHKGFSRTKVHDILRDLAIDILRKAPLGEWAHKCLFQPGGMTKIFPKFKCTQELYRISLIQSSILHLPNNLQFPNLQICLLSRISKTNEHLIVPKVFFSTMTNLRYLDLSNNDFEEELLNFKGLKSLTHLDLSGCGSLEKLSESIEELKALTYLDLRWCGSLKKLPESIGGLKALTHLDLNECRLLEKLPESIGELKALTHLDLDKCGSLEKLPESIEELKALTHFNLKWCGSLKKLPESIGGLKALTHFDLDMCGSLEKLPESIGELKALTHLDLKWCGSLKKLPKSIGGLKALIHLDLSKCRSLEKLPESIGELKALTHFDLKWCTSLEKLPENIGELKALTHFDLKWCTSLKKLPESIGELKALIHLDLNECRSLEKLPENIGELKALTYLDLSRCGSLEKLPESIGGLKALTHLDLNECGSLEKLPESIGELKALPHFNLKWYKSLEKLPESIGELKALNHLGLSGCGSLQKLPESIEELKALTHLDLRRCGSLKKLPESIGGLKALTHLNLNECGSLKKLPESIGELKALTHLLLSGCGSLEKLPKSIGELKALTHLDLNDVNRCRSFQKAYKS